ncbi:DnaD domain protein [Fructobacillus evanidus]|uniref:Replication initiation and membrane attachment protein DnaB (DnaB2) n=1 Tax=Fructobacillus evanidus TaxID=3064281 RepID=A0ABN9YMD2_9LACO|nr:Replication initiation and membrane attachment protein DnaB (DnaB2) [Fructobacillus sp. LMG 32999]CAK1231926.1 Replication initiation and membrane attachment protein DnaB (DnaB2) [Fructobacillus sp. LMG 32999]CAK1232711.1 Replication initiation and membrane attachment protein DnaB (DnaB2) [Fructobacillus sp. LMG 32999]CAK1236720.1 Replication initiation and membrane attachment protein DnaB (DnaB2) [Fructobacillus sp. LMG 32999]CAK1237794.1 Replication initiation and membrane attachment prote
MAVSKQTIEFQAKEPAYLSLQAPISLADLDRVFSLYLPFLGAKAYALYHFMVQESQAGTKKWSDHYLLLDTLTLSLPDLVHARKALEAVGLLKTFYQEAGGFVGYTYQIQPPMTARDFFNEDLLSGLLFYFAGEDRFQVLADRFGGQPAGQVTGTNVVNLSASFLEFFDNPVAGRQPSVELAGPGSLDDLDFSTQTFDYDAMVALIHGTTAANLAPDRQLIMTQQVLYGLNEAELATAITRSINLDDHHLNRAALMAYLQNQWGNNAEKTKLANRGNQSERPVTSQGQDNQAVGSASQQATGSQGQPTAQAPNNQSQPTQTTSKQSRALQSLYQAADLLSPIDFLRQIKENNHGYVTKSESQLLTNLVQQNILPVPVINILIYQVLVNMDNSDLKRNLVDSIANDWAKNQVDTAPKAVAAIKNHQNQQKARTNTNQSRYQGRYNRSGQKVEPKMAQNDQLANQASQGDDAAAMMALLKDRKTKN